MCSCRFRVFMEGGEGRILLHCHLEPEPIHIYLNVGMCLMIGESFCKGQKGSPPFSELKHLSLCPWLILSL